MLSIAFTLRVLPLENLWMSLSNIRYSQQFSLWWIFLWTFFIQLNLAHFVYFLDLIKLKFDIRKSFLQLWTQLSFALKIIIIKHSFKYANSRILCIFNRGGGNMGVSKLQLFGLKFELFYWNKKGPKNREFLFFFKEERKSNEQAKREKKKIIDIEI